MNRQEIEQDIRSCSRVCKGTPNLTPADQQPLVERWRSIEASGNWAAAIIFKRALEKSLGVGDAIMAADDWDSMLRRVAELIFGYKYDCGYDINDLILSEPLDGKEHSSPCPKCGRTITWTPGVYPTDDSQ